MILILDVYDFVKEVKKHMSISQALASTDVAQPYASDIPQKLYEVINHRTGEATKLEFNMNSTLQKSSNKVISKTDIPPVGKLIQGHRFNEAQYEQNIKRATGDANAGAVDENSSANSSLYSLKRHHHNERKLKRRIRTRVRSTSRKAEPLGTIEPIKEETADSNLRETLQSVNKQAESHQTSQQHDVLANLMNDVSF